MVPGATWWTNASLSEEHHLQLLQAVTDEHRFIIIHIHQGKQLARSELSPPTSEYIHDTNKPQQMGGWLHTCPPFTPAHLSHLYLNTWALNPTYFLFNHASFPNHLGCRRVGGGQPSLAAPQHPTPYGQAQGWVPRLVWGTTGLWPGTPLPAQPLWGGGNSFETLVTYECHTCIPSTHLTTVQVMSEPHTTMPHRAQPRLHHTLTSSGSRGGV